MASKAAAAVSERRGEEDIVNSERRRKNAKRAKFLVSRRHGKGVKVKWIFYYFFAFRKRHIAPC